MTRGVANAARGILLESNHTGNPHYMSENYYKHCIDRELFTGARIYIYLYIFLPRIYVFVKYTGYFYSFDSVTTETCRLGE